MQRFLTRKYLLLLLPIALVVILLITPMLQGQSDQRDNNSETIVLPTAFRVRPTLAGPATKPAVSYNQDGAHKLVDVLQNKQPLLAEEQQARATMLTKTGGKSGTIYQTAAFRVEYVQSADIFMVELTDIDINKGKKAAVRWFVAQGFSQQSVCTLPVVFYINRKISEQLRPLDVTFNPLANECI
jgi:hypothetical protein